MTGAKLHTVLRTAGHWSDSGDWIADAEQEITVSGRLYQLGASDLILDANGARPTATAWGLLVDEGEPDLLVAADGQHGDRVRHDDGLLTVVGRQDLGESSDLPRWRYDLIDRGQDPGAQS